jgi:hypothetical protein
MLADHQEHFRILRLRRHADWAAVWHPWPVVVPRRSITGRLVRGKVLRRYDGRKWIYKQFIAPAPRTDDRGP